MGAKEDRRKAAEELIVAQDQARKLGQAGKGGHEGVARAAAEYDKATKRVREGEN